MITFLSVDAVQSKLVRRNDSLLYYSQVGLATNYNVDPVRVSHVFVQLRTLKPRSAHTSCGAASQRRNLESREGAYPARNCVAHFFSSLQHRLRELGEKPLLISASLLVVREKHAKPRLPILTLRCCTSYDVYFYFYHLTFLSQPKDMTLASYSVQFPLPLPSLAPKGFVCNIVYFRQQRADSDIAIHKHQKSATV